MRPEGTGSVLGVRVRAVSLVALAAVAVMSIAALQGLPTFGNVLGVSPAPLPSQEQPTAPAADLAAPPITESNPWFGIIAAVIGTAIAVIFVILLARVLVRVVREWWRARPLDRVDGSEQDAVGSGLGAEEPVAAPTVRRGIANALVEVDKHPDPGDAIIAAWVGLEQSAERAGQTRGPAETAGEFTVRIVATRRASEQDIRALLRLYESVRFGGLAASEQDRASARGLLHSIEEHWR